MFCVRGFGGGVGVSLFFGGLFWLVRRVFSGFWGFLVSRSFCSMCWGGWRVVGGSGVRGLARLFPALLLVGGGFGGASARVRFLVVRFWLWSGSVGRGAGVRVARLPAVLWWGSGCARFPVRVRGVVVVFAGGFRVLFFPSGALCFLLVSGVGLRGLAGGGGLWGVSGWVRGFFLRLLLYWPGLVSGFLRGGWFGFGLGFVWRV